MPPMWEVLGNITNLIWIVGISLLLLMMSDDPRSGAGKVGEFAAVAVFGLSGFMIVFIAPWFAWRWRRTRSRHSLAVFCVAVPPALLEAVILLLSDRDKSGGSLVFLPRVWVERIGLSWLFGDKGLPDSAWWIVLWLGALVWCIGAVVITVVVLQRTAVTLWLLHFTLLAAPVLNTGYMPPPFSCQRYFVIPTAIVIVLLVAVIGARRWAIAAVVWLAVGVGAMLQNFAPAPYWPDPLRPLCYFRPEVNSPGNRDFKRDEGCLPSVHPVLRDPRSTS
jgi:hypothetical protein